MFVDIFGSCFEPESHSGQIRMAVRVELWVHRRARAVQNYEGKPRRTEVFENKLDLHVSLLISALVASVPLRKSLMI